MTGIVTGTGATAGATVTGAGTTGVAATGECAGSAAMLRAAPRCSALLTGTAAHGITGGCKELLAAICDVTLCMHSPNVCSFVAETTETATVIVATATATAG